MLVFWCQILQKLIWISDICICTKIPYTLLYSKFSNITFGSWNPPKINILYHYYIADYKTISSFPISWYYINVVPTPKRVSVVRKSQITNYNMKYFFVETLELLAPSLLTTDIHHSGQKTRGTEIIIVPFLF